MKRILITNDDGIGSDGIVRLARAAKKFGEVWVVAPDRERSGVSHSIHLHTPIDITPADFPVEGVHAFSCTGSPADCVRIGSLYVMKAKPHCLLSGINFGYNTGSDTQYSGTVGAATEGSYQGFLSIALSEGTKAHEVTDAWLEKILEGLLKKDPIPGQIWNVNFPDCPLSECKGILRNRLVSTGTFYEDDYDVIEELPDGGKRLMVHGTHSEECEEGTDMDAVLGNYISIGLVNNLGFPVLH